MTGVNKKHFDKELKNAAWERFSKMLNKSNSGEALAENLKKLFTSAEIVMIEKRLTILVLLERGLSYREIRRVTDVSPNTISSIKNSFVKN